MADTKLSAIVDELTDFTESNIRIYLADVNVPITSKFLLLDKLITHLNSLYVVLADVDQTKSGNLKIGGQATGGDSSESFSATKTFDLDDGNAQEMTLTANVTSLTLDNKVNGGSYLIYLIQDATGGRTIPPPDSTFGNKTDNSVSDFVTDSNAVNIINVNVRPNGTTYWTLETYTP
jgi:hypothetical protein